jgi:hypothetical protein
MPVYTVPTKQDAEDLILLVGSKQYVEHPNMPGKPWYKLSVGRFVFVRHLEPSDLDEISQILDQNWQLIQQRRP